jgi:hypothetical protein
VLTLGAMQKKIFVRRLRKNRRSYHTILNQS